MNKAGIVKRVSVASGLLMPRAVEAVEAVFNQLRILMADGETCCIRGFGMFSTRVREQRHGHNPKTMEPLLIEARTVVKFKASYRLKDIVAGLNDFNTLFKVRRTRRVRE